MRDVAVNLQTPIMRSALVKINKWKKEHGHENNGDTIAWMVDEIERCRGKPNKGD